MQPADRREEENDADWRDADLIARHLHPRPNPALSKDRAAECHNIVGLAYYKCELNPFLLSQQVSSLEFKRANFPAVTIRLSPPRISTLLAFGNGKTVQMGVHSKAAFVHAVQNARSSLIGLGYAPKLTPVRLENRVYSLDVGFCVAVWEVEFEDELGCTYAPDLFPGLVYRMFWPPVTALVFCSGKNMFLGVRSSAHLNTAVQHLKSILVKNQYSGTKENALRLAKSYSATRRGGIAANWVVPADSNKDQKQHSRRIRAAVKAAVKRSIQSRDELVKIVVTEYGKIVEAERKRSETAQRKREKTERHEALLQAQQTRREERIREQEQSYLDAVQPGAHEPRSAWSDAYAGERPGFRYLEGEEQEEPEALDEAEDALVEQELDLGAGDFAEKRGAPSGPAQQQQHKRARPAPAEQTGGYEDMPDLGL